jgi:hypothetical protein
MSDNQNIAGSMYHQTKGTMEPEKEREPIHLSSTAADIVSDTQRGRGMQQRGTAQMQPLIAHP